VLMGQSGKLRPIYQLMLAQESAEWEQSNAIAEGLKIPHEEVSDLWWEALRWAEQALRGM
jgi:hypothetical protein